MDKIKQSFKELNKITILWFLLIIILLELFSVGMAAMVTKYHNDTTFWGKLFYENERVYGRIFAYVTAFILFAIFAKLAKDSED